MRTAIIIIKCTVSEYADRQPGGSSFHEFVLREIKQRMRKVKFKDIGLKVTNEILASEVAVKS